MMYAESVKNRDIYPGIKMLFLEYLHKPFLYIYQVDYMDSKGMKCYYVCNNYITGLFESFA